MLPLSTKSGFVLEGLLTTCSFDYINRDFVTRSNQIALIIGGFCVPFFVFILFYILTYKALKKKGNIFRKKCLRRSSCCKVILGNTGPEAVELIDKYMIRKYLPVSENPDCLIHIDTRFNNSLTLRENKLARSISLILLCFCLAWMPYAAITLLSQFGSHSERYITPWTTSIPSLLAKLSSVYNPIIYFLTYPNCKAFYKKKFGFKLEK